MAAIVSYGQGDRAEGDGIQCHGATCPPSFPAFVRDMYGSATPRKVTPICTQPQRFMQVSLVPGLARLYIAMISELHACNRMGFVDA